MNSSRMLSRNISTNTNRLQALALAKTYSPSINARLCTATTIRHNSNTPAASPTSPLPDDRRLSLTFTCKVCNHRSTHEFAKSSYDNGVVLVQCPSCENRHLIADRLGWFKDNKGGVGLEEIMKERGDEIVKRGRLANDGTIEFYDQDHKGQEK